VPKPEERMALVIQMHEDLGHFGEQRTLVEICRRYFWHNWTEDVKMVVKMCKQCQMVRSMGSVHSEDEEMKSIPVCELFYRILWILQGHYLKPSQGTNTFLSLLIITQNGAKQRLLLTMVPKQQQNSWKMM
jgi:hypothetical protein